MSTPDQPDTPPLTRRQMREIRNTGSTPIIVPADEEPVVEPEPEPPAAPTPAPLARAAGPAPVAPAPDAHVDLDLGVAPLTRRQARQQERIRTASIPVVMPDFASGHELISEVPPQAAEKDTAETASDAPAQTTVGEGAIAGESADRPEISGEVVGTAHDESGRTDGESADDETKDADASESAVADGEPGDDDEPASRIVHPALGSELLEGQVPAAKLPPSFDQLIARNASTTGSVSASNALILSQTPAGSPLVAPVTATGEVLITGTFELPEGLGSVGHAPGTADGKDLDVALIDGELPAASSPTPIAASAAISTARNSGEEIIRPPAPEKGGRLMLALIITAGVLALAVAGTLVILLTTGRI